MLIRTCINLEKRNNSACLLDAEYEHYAVIFSSWCLNNHPIVQEAVGYFFCLEDRALFCRKCDVAIHTVNSLVSSHQRFLLTGVRVGLEAADFGVSSSTGKSNSCDKVPEAEKSQSVPGSSVPMSATSQFSKVMPVQAVGAGDFLPPKMPFTGGGSAESIQQWHFDDFLGLSDLSQSYNYIDDGSSKVTCGLLLNYTCIGPRENDINSTCRRI